VIVNLKMRTPNYARSRAKRKQEPHIPFFARKEPGDLEPTVEHVQVGEDAMEKAVDVRKNLRLEHSQAMVLTVCWSTLDDIETFSLFPEI
jgi:hypothetical protein